MIVQTIYRAAMPKIAPAHKWGYTLGREVKITFEIRNLFLDAERMILRTKMAYKNRRGTGTGIHELVINISYFLNSY